MPYADIACVLTWLLEVFKIISYNNTWGGFHGWTTRFWGEKNVTSVLLIAVFLVAER